MVYIFALFAVLTASFQEFFIISFLVIIHEIGHCLLVCLWKGKVKEIKIYPLGGISKFYWEDNISPWKELSILMAGPIFQCFAFLLLCIILPNKIEMISAYHFRILLFNLLPIYPLDGGKLCFLLFQMLLPWKKSLKISIGIGYGMVLFFLFQESKKWNWMIMIILLCTLLWKEQKKVSYHYQKFLLERYLHSYVFSKTKIIKNKDNFYRNKNHLIEENGKYYWEKEYLEKNLKIT